MQPKKKLKVLFAEDQDSIAIGVRNTLKEMNYEFAIEHTRYCDDAWLKLKKAQLNKEPFDILITDLSFKPDHRHVELANGEDLISTVRKDGILCKIIVFSVEDRPLKVKNLFDTYNIDGYVVKGRQDNSEIAKAIRNLVINENFISEEIRQKIHLNKNVAQVKEMDLLVIQLLCKGYSQEEISQYLQENNIKPNSVSTIEKQLKNLRDEFSAKTNIELVVIIKEMGLV